MSRNRRDQEKTEITELASLMPLSPAIKDQLDRVSVIKMTTAYFSLRNLIHGEHATDGSATTTRPNDAYGLFKMFRAHDRYRNEPIEGFSFNTLQTMDGFALVLDSKGKIIYVSETAAVHLGVAQVEMIGTSIFDHLHVGDAPSIQFSLAIGLGEEHILIDNPEISFMSRWRCSLAKRNAGITTFGYKTIHFIGRILPENHCRFIGYGQPLVNYGLNEMKINSSQFVFRATPSLHLIFVDSRIFQLLGYGPSNVVDQSFYKLVHADDSELIRQAHRTVIEKHQAVTGYYRLLSNNGGVCWVETKFAIVQQIRSSISQCIVGVTTVLGIEGDQIMDCVQQTMVTETSQTVMGEYSQNHYAPFALKEEPEDPTHNTNK